MDILDLFWDNVFWHIENKGLKEENIIGKSYCISAHNRTYNPSLKTAQMILYKLPEFEIEEVSELSDSERGAKGFGSSDN